MKYVFVFLLLSFQSRCLSQKSDPRVDSVFNFYFKVVEVEINPTKYPHEKYSQFYDSSVSNVLGKTVYFGKYVPQVSSFLEKISKIKADRIKQGDVYVSRMSEQNLIKWKIWYDRNKNKIHWDSRKKIPILKK